MFTRLPTTVKELRGTLRPCRENPNEPRPSGPLGDPPAHLAKDEKAIWRETIKITVPGVLTIQDRYAVELLCNLMAKLRRREPMTGPDRGQLSYLLSHLGLTPADRAKVSVTPVKTDDDDGIGQFVN